MWRHGTLFYIIIANFKKIKEPNRVRYRTDSTKNEMIKNYEHQMWLKRKSKIFFRHILYPIYVLTQYRLLQPSRSYCVRTYGTYLLQLSINIDTYKLYPYVRTTENNYLIKGNWDINIPSLVLFAEIDTVHRIFAWSSRRVKELKGQCSHDWSQPQT